MFTLTLTYANGSLFTVGGFPTQDAAQAWLTAEKTKPYWISTTTSNITEQTINTSTNV